MKMPVFPFTNILNSWHGVITPLAFVGADGMYFEFCIYFSILLKELELELTSALQIHKNGIY